MKQAIDLYSLCPLKFLWLLVIAKGVQFRLEILFCLSAVSPENCDSALDGSQTSYKKSVSHQFKVLLENSHGFSVSSLLFQFLGPLLSGFPVCLHLCIFPKTMRGPEQGGCGSFRLPLEMTQMAGVCWFPSMTCSLMFSTLQTSYSSDLVSGSQSAMNLAHPWPHTRSPSPLAAPRTDR